MFPSVSIIYAFFSNRGIEDLEGLEEMCCNLVRDMNEYGVCVLDNFIGEEKGLKVLQETKSMYSAGYFKVSTVTSLLIQINQDSSFSGWSISC